MIRGGRSRRTRRTTRGVPWKQKTNALGNEMAYQTDPPVQPPTDPPSISSKWTNRHTHRQTHAQVKPHTIHRINITHRWTDRQTDLRVQCSSTDNDVTKPLLAAIEEDTVTGALHDFTETLNAIPPTGAGPLMTEI